MALTKTFKIPNKQGLHARPAALFVKTANKYQSEIWVKKDGEDVNGKSIMGLMMLAAEYGAEVEISCDGEDAEQAMSEIEGLITGGFEGT